MGSPGLVLDATIRCGTSAPVGARFLVQWSDAGAFRLAPIDDAPIVAGFGLITGEHVQACLEDAGWRPEAGSHDALFAVDEVVRLTTPPLFVVGTGARSPIGIVDDSGQVLTRVRGGPGRLETARSRAAEVLRAVAPIGFRSLTDGRLSLAGADEVAVFGRLLAGLDSRRGIGVRELQDWATARSCGDPGAVAEATSALATGPQLEASVYAVVVASLGLPQPLDRMERPVRSRGTSLRSDLGSVAL